MTFSIGQKVECVDDTRSIGGVENCHVNFGTVTRITKARVYVSNECGNQQVFKLDGTSAHRSTFPRRIRRPITYAAPRPGVVFDTAAYTVDEINRKVIRMALRLGWEDTEAETLTDQWSESTADNDASQWLNETADDAVAWLNEQETRLGLYWSFDGEAGAFGLWVDVESAKEVVEFVSTTKQEAPPDDFRGQWLHVNDHGNATLYLRTDSGQSPDVRVDLELWSIV